MDRVVVIQEKFYCPTDGGGKLWPKDFCIEPPPTYQIHPFKDPKNHVDLGFSC